VRLSPFELMRMHVEALYVHDERDRLRGVNQWGGGVAPRMFLGRTRSGHVLRFRADVDAELVAELTHIWEESLRGPDSAGVAEQPACGRALVAALAKRQPVERTWAGPAYVAPRAAASAAANRVVTIRAENAHLLRGGLDAWLSDVPHLQPFIATLEGERAVAVCASVRITDAAHEAGVETLARRATLRTRIARSSGVDPGGPSAACHSALQHELGQPRIVRPRRAARPAAVRRRLPRDLI
jgi:hypothetical protein